MTRRANGVSCRREYLAHSFTIKPAVASKLGFGVQPSNAATGSAITPAVQVDVLDTYGNVVTADNSDQVTLAVASGPGGFTAGSTTTVTVSAGIATFSNLVLDTAGSYTLAESATGSLTGPASAGFTVEAAAASLNVSAPSTATAGTGFSPKFGCHFRR